MEQLKIATDRRFKGLWIGEPPKLLESTDLIPGDVLFCAPLKNVGLASLIQAKTAGIYTHCAIHVGEGQIVDLTISGIRTTLISSFLDGYKYLAVCRCPGQKWGGGVATYAKEAAVEGAKYDFWGALRVSAKEYKNIEEAYYSGRWNMRQETNKHIRSCSPQRMFCSGFVVRALESSGYIPEGDQYFNSAKWSPSGLADENIVHLAGYMSKKGLSGVDRNDHFLGGNGHVLSHE